MGRVKSKTLRLMDAAKMLELSYRQTKRLWKRYRGAGAQGLKHRSAGRGSNRAKPETLRRKALQLIREKYSGTRQERFGPTLAAEHLAKEDRLEVGEETLRRWELAEGLWSRMRKRKAHRKRRARREHFGDLVQLDGSFHTWFEERGPRGCLMNMVDDATGKTNCRMGKQETIWAAAGVLRSWIEKYGVPRALYTDWKNVYKREPTERERLQGKAATTQFGRMCERLEIRIIAASSPQAKGRVVRLETERWISNDWVVQYRGHFLQLKPQNKRYGPTQAKALICAWEDGAVEVHYRGERIDYDDLVVRPEKVAVAPDGARRKPAKHGGSKPVPNHPWREGYEQRMKQQLLDGRPVPRLVGVSTCASP
jgi:hypothetical protein